MLRTFAISLLSAQITTAEFLEVTLYNIAGAPAQVLDEARQSLGATLRRAGIELRWSAGDPSAPEAVLVDFDGPTGAGPAARRCAARRSIAVALMSDAAPGLSPATLGYALPFAARGINVHLFYDRVQARADAFGVQPAIVLAFGMAHEIGHVLLRSLDHTRGGLMSSWRDNEFRLMTRATLSFEKHHAASMRTTLAGVGCQVARDNLAVNAGSAGAAARSR
jgi:hypothetical protein